MSLRQEQSLFALDIANLFQFLIQEEFEWTFGEAERTEYQQAEYLRTGKSKTANSQHLKRLALDLNIFKNGELCGFQELKIVGAYWESLHDRNRWGGSWRGAIERKESTFVDTPHFERIG